MIKLPKGYQFPFYRVNNKKIAKLYEKAIKDMTTDLVGRLSIDTNDNYFEAQQLAIIKQLNRELGKLAPQARTEVENMIEKSVLNGSINSNLWLGKALTVEEARQMSMFSQINTGLIDTLVRDTMGDLLLATNNTEVSIKRMVRQVINERMQYGVAVTQGVPQMADLIKKQLTKEALKNRIYVGGFIGIVDKAGRRWKLDTYVDMATETKIMQAHNEATRLQGYADEVDLAQISSHGAKDSCSFWEGVVISMNGETAGFPTYAEAVSSHQVFHPNCRHHINPVRRVDLLSERDQLISEEQTANLSKVVGATTPREIEEVKKDL